MGVYWNNFIYYGAVLTSEQGQQLTENNQYQTKKDLYDRFLLIRGQNYILHIPQSYYDFKNIDPMFESCEIEQGFVDYDEIKSCLEKRLDTHQIANLLNFSDSQKSTFNEIIELCSHCGLDVGPKMSQCVWTTFSLSQSDCQLEHTLRVHFSDQLCTSQLVIGQIYRHYKNQKLYEIIGCGRHTETLEEMIIYKALYDDSIYGPSAVWIRPKEMFMESVEHEGQMVPRFRLI
jgi:hypothetical protein